MTIVNYTGYINFLQTLILINCKIKSR